MQTHNACSLAVLGAVVTLAAGGCGDAPEAGGSNHDQQLAALDGPVGGATGCSVSVQTTVGGGGVMEWQVRAFQNGSPSNPTYAGVEDTTIEKASPASNQSADEYCRVKGGGSERSCLIRFNLTALPTNALVNKACLHLTIADPSVRTFAARRLLQPWMVGQATWNEYKSFLAWGALGAKGVADRDPADIAIIPSYSPAGTISVPIDIAVVQEWVSSPSTNNGVTLAESAASDGISFYSSEVATVAERPMLSVGYRLP
jgi:hypothetical protein